MPTENGQLQHESTDCDYVRTNTTDGDVRARSIDGDAIASLRLAAMRMTMSERT